MNGVFLINKKENWTSFDVCNFLRKKFSTKKVGHSGTLDPFAEGLMIVCLGQATKIIPFMENYQKTYLATIKLGEETDTLDKTGNIIIRKDVPILDKDEIKKVLNSFLGKSKQIPPMYSALKKDGVCLYTLAREGIYIERKPRDIEILSIELISYQAPYLTFLTTVSKGTYIRSLAKDIANKLNTVGHLVTLKREKIGDIDLLKAKEVNDINENDKISIQECLSFIPSKIVDKNIERDIRNGKKLILGKEELYLLLDQNSSSLAIYEKRDEYHYPKRGLFDANN